ncbi:MAG: TIGR00282 family metallophosphoesterase [Pelosinus sp.]|nr:TIGR00282 family metallophosphoesterase [Pelosinus sp.]
MKVMMIGDICGKSGRQAAAHYIPLLQKEHGLDLVIANGENSAGGIGITKDIAAELLSMGIDMITTGNHIWDKKEIFDFIAQQDKLLRPANYPAGTLGQGYQIIKVGIYRLAIINLAGRVFMPPIDCPFQCAEAILKQISDKCDMIIIDFHAEATSEKMALAWYLDGKVSCIAGTHTHIQTADNRILPSGTAYISDLGMVGAWNSILGMEKEAVIRKFVTGLPARFTVAKGQAVFCAIIVTINAETGRAENITRVQEFF